MIMKKQLGHEDESLKSTQPEHKIAKKSKDKAKTTEEVVENEFVKNKSVKIESPTTTKKKM